MRETIFLKKRKENYVKQENGETSVADDRCLISANGTDIKWNI